MPSAFNLWDITSVLHTVAIRWQWLPETVVPVRSAKGAHASVGTATTTFSGEVICG